MKLKAPSVDVDGIAEAAAAAEHTEQIVVVTKRIFCFYLTQNSIELLLLLYAKHKKFQVKRAVAKKGNKINNTKEKRQECPKMMGTGIRNWTLVMDIET